MIDADTKELIAAYFEGGNAENKSYQEVRDMMHTIKDFVESADQQ